MYLVFWGHRMVELNFRTNVVVLVFVYLVVISTCSFYLVINSIVTHEIYEYKYDSRNNNMYLDFSISEAINRC